MLARLQRHLLLFQLALAGAWLLYWWSRSVGLALAGLCIPVLNYAMLLACQFALRVTHSDAPAPTPHPLQWLRAWSTELWHGLQVFFWRQPFREHAQPDRMEGNNGQRGVVFIHGLFCNRAFWAPWLRQAQARHMPAMAVSLAPVFADIDSYVSAIDAAVRQMAQATGRAPVLVCHSMGGLAARAWLRRCGGGERVAHVVTIGSPHSGTWLARLGHGPSARQMELGSGWLAQLADDEQRAPAVAFTCWYSNCDNMVFPTTTATRPHADNRLVPGLPHVALAFHPRVMQETLASVQAS
jgi:triacylglycerol lipase